MSRHWRMHARDSRSPNENRHEKVAITSPESSLYEDCGEPRISRGRGSDWTNHFQFFSAANAVFFCSGCSLPFSQSVL